MKILGLHYDHPFIRWAALELKGKKYELQSLKSLVEADVKRLYKQEQKDLVAVGMTTLVRHLDFKISSLTKIEKGLSFQIESLTSLPSDQVVYCSQITPVGNGAEATVFLAAKDTLVEQLSFWKQLGIVPDLVSSNPQGLLRFAQLRCPTLTSGLIVHLGSRETICVYFDAAVVKKAFVLDEGIDTFLATLWEDRKKVLFENEVQSVAKQIDLLHLKSHLNPLLSAQLEQFSSRLRGVLSSFQKGAAPLSVLFTGRSDAFVNLSPFLLKDVPEISLFHPPLPLNQEELKGAIAIGLAMEASMKKSKKVQFLTGDFIPVRQWQKAGRSGLLLLALSLISSVGGGWFGLQQLEEKKIGLEKKLTHIISQVDQPLASTLFSEGLEVGVAKAMSALQKYDREALFLLQAPTVTEVLAWVSNHELFTTFAKSGDPLELIHLKYDLVSLPKIGHAREPYRAKVEMQFHLKQSMSARKMHETLLRGDALVDSSQEITWEPLNDGYQATFYLKNRAPYVQ